MLLAVCPGGVFVVEGAVSEAAVEDADEPVAQSVQCAVMCVAVGSVVVVERSGAGAGGERSEGPQVAGIGESAVAGVAARAMSSAAGWFDVDGSRSTIGVLGRAP